VRTSTSSADVAIAASRAASCASDFLTVAEIATLLKLSKDAVRQRFESLPGVIDVGSPETNHKRKYAVLRVPRAVLDKYLQSVKVA
jgi:hypothetical protein